MFIKKQLNFERIFYYSALIFAFIIPLSRAGVSFFIIWFIFLFLIQKQYCLTWGKIKNNHVFWAMSAFLGFLTISLLWTENISDGLNQMRLYSYWIIIPILAVNLKREWLQSIITAFLMGMFLSEIIAYGIYFEWWTFKDRTPQYPTPFMSHIHYSVFLATTSIILLSRLLSKRYKWYTKFPMLLFFLTATGNLMISTGRTGQLAFFIAMAIAIIIHYRMTFKSLALFSLLSAILTLGGYSSIPIFKQRIDQGINDIQQLLVGNFDTSWGLRAAFWTITYDSLKKHPLIGFGVGDYRIASHEILENDPHQFSPSVKEWCSNTHFHNQYLMILTQIGLIGFGLMLWLIIELFKLKINDPELNEFKILSLTIFFVGSIAEPLWILQFPIILFVFIVSLSIAASDKNDKVSLV